MRSVQNMLDIMKAEAEVHVWLKFCFVFVVTGVVLPSIQKVKNLLNTFACHLHRICHNPTDILSVFFPLICMLSSTSPLLAC